MEFLPDYIARNIPQPYLSRKIQQLEEELGGKLPMFHIAIAWRRDNQSKILSNFLNVAREVSCH